MVKVKNFAIFCRFVQLKFAESKNVRIFAVLFREHSSVGLEHLPYKQRVGGSTPSAPTKALEKSKAFFVYAQHWHVCMARRKKGILVDGRLKT